MKQARAYGVGVVVATQNPMDLDYRALSNAGLWCLGRLQTDADRERVLDGLGEPRKKGKVATILKQLLPRWFLVRDARDGRPPTLLQPRWAMSYLRGPMTREQIRAARLGRASPADRAQKAAAAVSLDPAEPLDPNQPAHPNTS